MEVHVRQDEGEQVVEALEVQVAAGACGHGDVARLRAVEGRGRHRHDVGDGALDAVDQLLEARLGIVELRRLAAHHPPDAVLGDVGGDLHLPRQREHVRGEAHAEQHGRVPALGAGVGLALHEDVLELRQGADKGGNGQGVHGRHWRWTGRQCKSSS